MVDSRRLYVPASLRNTNLVPASTQNEQSWQSPVAISLVALALRLSAVHFFYHSTWNEYEDHLTFGFETGRIARSIAEGRGYGNPLLAQTGPTAWLTPVYPCLLAGVFKLFGLYSKASALVILSLNSLFSAVTTVPIFYVALRYFGRSVAIAACWVWALYPYFIYIPGGFVWDTCLGSLLATLFFLFAITLQGQPRPWKWFALGLLGGLAALTNASTLTLSLILSVWAIYLLWRNSRRWISAVLLLAIGLSIPLLPWEVRNYLTLHTLIPLRDNLWLEFRVGNNGNTQSWLNTDVHPSISREQKAEFVRLGEIAYMRQKRRESLDFLSKYPGLYALLCLRRFVYLWTAFWNLDPSNLQDEFHGFANVYFTVALTTAMLLGLARAFRSSAQAALPFLLVLLCYPLVFYLTHPTIRYRHVIDPEVAILAAVGIRSLIHEGKPNGERTPWMQLRAVQRRSLRF